VGLSKLNDWRSLAYLNREKSVVLTEDYKVVVFFSSMKHIDKSFIISSITCIQKTDFHFMHLCFHPNYAYIVSLLSMTCDLPPVEFY